MVSKKTKGDISMSMQQYSRLRFVQAISQLPANENVKPKFATGHVWGWRDSMDAH
jgi:hypothetical protein|tara:strand:- start:2611 stop:2775 length:165 start_codon:yes stop_codon:yes gene_type:complete